MGGYENLNRGRTVKMSNDLLTFRELSWWWISRWCYKLFSYILHIMTLYVYATWNEKPLHFKGGDQMKLRKFKKFL